MIGYDDRTFCTGDGCKRFAVDCQRSLTKEIRDQAERWWGGKDVPITQFANPRELECYVPNENTQ
jgi:hypothetical protein